MRSDQKIYDLPIKIELKIDTDVEISKIYNHIEMCLNVVNRLREDLLPAHKYTKIHSEFE